MQRESDAIIDLREKIESAIKNVEGINNIVPTTLKRTFNFKGRKSIEIAEKILSSLAPSEHTLVCDPFVGSNSFGIAAINCGYQFTGSELDNYTYSALDALFTKCNRKTLIAYYQEVKENCMNAVMSLYETRCCNYIFPIHK